MGPKIALAPFLEKTKKFDAKTQRAVGRHMVVTAVVTALVLFAFGALLMRLLPIIGGAVAVGGGIILAILAINMVSGPGKKVVEEARERTLVSANATGATAPPPISTGTNVIVGDPGNRKPT